MTEREGQKMKELTEELQETREKNVALEAALDRRTQQIRQLRRQINEGLKVRKNMWLLFFLTMTLNMGLIAGNLAGLKIWQIGQIPVDGGIIVFPITYIAGDLIVEFFRQKMADLVAALIAVTGVIMCGGLKLVELLLPDFPGADNSAFLHLQSAMGRMFLASTLSFFLGQLINNYVFERIRQYRSARKDILVRALGSSIPAHLVDALIFEIAAFVGKLSMSDFVKQVLFAFVAGLMIEALLSPLTRFVAMRIDPNRTKVKTDQQAKVIKIGAFRRSR